MISTRLTRLVRNFSTSATRNSLPGGCPGENLPFSITNRNRLTFLFAVFFGSASAIPFFHLRHHLLKQRST